MFNVISLSLLLIWLFDVYVKLAMLSALVAAVTCETP
jgi:hypothetical protein